jgi:hypothetical protein
MMVTRFGEGEHTDGIELVVDRTRPLVAVAVDRVLPRNLYEDPTI